MSGYLLFTGGSSMVVGVLLFIFGLITKQDPIGAVFLIIIGFVLFILGKAIENYYIMKDEE